jgi:hypothetical protein
MRHVLRTWVEAVRALAAFFEQLEAAPKGTSARASMHLARAFGGRVDGVSGAGAEWGGGGGGGGVAGEGEVWNGPGGWRDAKEVVTFLRRRGGKIAGLRYGIEGGWAASSGTDAEGPPAEGSDAGVGETE